MTGRNTKLLAEIAAFLARNPGISETTFGRKAVNDGKLVNRLRDDKRVWPETELQIRQFMQAHSFPSRVAA